MIEMQGEKIIARDDDYVGLLKDRPTLPEHDTFRDWLNHYFVPKPLTDDGRVLEPGMRLTNGKTVREWEYTSKHDEIIVYQVEGCAVRRECWDEICLLPEDTQEKIDKDAVKEPARYWGCDERSCYECPAVVDGLKPYERYKRHLGDMPDGQTIRMCIKAQRLDLLRRQRELIENKEASL